MALPDEGKISVRADDRHAAQGLGSIATWGDFPRRLSERTGAGVFVYSRSGYGGSPPTQAQLPLHYIRRHALGALPKILDTIRFGCPECGAFDLHGLILVPNLSTRL